VKALIVVDVQNDFLPGGALPVQGGFEIVEPILALAKDADVIVKTGDCHPPQRVTSISGLPIASGIRGEPSFSLRLRRCPVPFSIRG
jgi:nicotinamidase-related amidase